MGAARWLGRPQNKRLRPPGNTVPAPPLELPEPEVPLDGEPVPVVVLDPPELAVVPDGVEVGWALPAEPAVAPSVGVATGSFAAAGWLLLTGAGVLSDALPGRGGLLEAGGGA